METELEAVNGRRVRAIEVFCHALRFFREHALKVHFKAPVWRLQTVNKVLLCCSKYFALMGAHMFKECVPLF